MKIYIFPEEGDAIVGDEFLNPAGRWECCEVGKPLTYYKGFAVRRRVGAVITHVPLYDLLTTPRNSHEQS